MRADDDALGERAKRREGVEDEEEQDRRDNQPDQVPPRSSGHKMRERERERGCECDVLGMDDGWMEVCGGGELASGSQGTGDPRPQSDDDQSTSPDSPPPPTPIISLLIARQNTRTTQISSHAD